MKYPFYQGKGVQRSPEQPLTLPQPQVSVLDKPAKYLPDDGLIAACNVALLLGQPLLLTGEPGSGKTAFAYSLAWELGLEPPLKFEAKSNSESRDLFYTYDALKRYQDSRSGGKNSEVGDYLDYQALGKAILHATKHPLNPECLPRDIKQIEKKRSVVLIDEIDKAPRDFPNDILNELEQMYFRIPELGNVQITADPALLPIVILTSNGERDLPEAFLRRCIYYHIAFPDPDKLTKIVELQLGLTAEKHPFSKDVLDLFEEFRKGKLLKNPSTAELLGWMYVLKEQVNEGENPLEQMDLILKTLGILIKNENDQKKAKEIVGKWKPKSSQTL